MPNRVSLVRTVAKFIFEEACHLVATGLGHDLYGTDLGFPGVADNIPLGTPEQEYSDACIRFIRYIAQVLAYTLEESLENEDPNVGFHDLINTFDNNGEI